MSTHEEHVRQQDTRQQEPGVRRRPLVLHDADCGFCTRCALLIPRLGADVDISSLQAEDLGSLGVDADRARTEMPVLLPGGDVAWGHHAWAAILRACPRPWRVLGVLMEAPVLDAVAARTYRFVAQHRERMPGGTPACAMPASR